MGAEPVTLPSIAAAATPLGLAARGAFHPAPDELPRPEGTAPLRTVVLLGWIGGAQWPAFASSPEAADGAPDPLDRWSMRVVGVLAAELGAFALFPFAGPPWLPFQRWAARSEPVHPSPLGLLIHPEWGLWHSYRGALGFAQELDIPRPVRAQSPCDACLAKPCLSACPISAFAPGAYDVALCRGYVHTGGGRSCASAGCASRLACPVGRPHAYGPEQTAFHMRAFATP